MQLPVHPLATSAVGGGGFLAVLPRSLRERRGRTCRKVVSFSSSGKGGEESAAPGETPEEARRRLAELDALLEGLVEPKMRPPMPPPPPDLYMDRDMITGRGSTDELPEFSPTYVAFSTLALVILTIFTNVMFNLYIKPSVDGVDQPVRIQRVPLVNPADRQFE
ncbi:hypothetical protein SETIT_2G358000v2 [Setaria italica]|uniref:Uncharacterized protein n=1 Tax=Setaria italica TaxID=4555 RepID=K3ZXK1_SETIT|nr:uncharacterized protein LOC101772625 [Setaria italica]RCV13595.1 hypothetical protein SETIT_2G358000v2 [Setaria italica]